MAADLFKLRSGEFVPLFVNQDAMGGVPARSWKTGFNKRKTKGGKTNRKMIAYTGTDFIQPGFIRFIQSGVVFFKGMLLRRAPDNQVLPY